MAFVAAASTGAVEGGVLDVYRRSVVTLTRAREVPLSAGTPFAVARTVAQERPTDRMRIEPRLVV